MKNGKICVGIIGCGTISDIYLTNLTGHFTELIVKSCADMFPDKSDAVRQKYDLEKSCSVDDLLADPEIDIVVNLTIPLAHHDINMKALNAGKHVYCEKPLALNLADADIEVELASSKKLLLCSAPDTFLGAGLQTCRKLLDEGTIGQVHGFTANLVSPGHELWHPAPEFYYKKGAGPMMDMGPYYITALVALFGPIRQISCLAHTTRPTRDVYGKQVEVEVLTHYAGLVEFASGVIGNINMSFDVWYSKLPLIEVYGATGTMEVPDPNMFGGPVRVFDGNEMVAEVSKVEGPYINRLMKMHHCGPELIREAELAFPAENNPRSNMRGFGVADMAAAIQTGRKSRLSADLSRHVVEALTAFDVASRENKPYQMTTTCERPEPMTSGLALWQVV